MYLHAHAKLGLAARFALVQAVEGGCSIRSAATGFNVSPATAHRWWHRWLEAGEEARRTLSCLFDRPAVRTDRTGAAAKPMRNRGSLVARSALIPQFLGDARRVRDQYLAVRGLDRRWSVIVAEAAWRRWLRWRRGY